MEKYKNMIISRDNALKLINALSEKLIEDKENYIIIREDIPFLIFNEFKEKQ